MQRRQQLVRATNVNWRSVRVSGGPFAPRPASAARRWRPAAAERREPLSAPARQSIFKHTHCYVHARLPASLRQSDPPTGARSFFFAKFTRAYVPVLAILILISVRDERLWASSDYQLGEEEREKKTWTCLLLGQFNTVVNSEGRTIREPILTEI